MPSNLKWELISFAIKILPLVLGAVLAWSASKKPTLKKAFAEISEIVKEAAKIINQVYVEPAKSGGKWDEQAKMEARSLFWTKFLELAERKAGYWLNFLLGQYGEEGLKSAIIYSDLEAALQDIKK